MATRKPNDPLAVLILLDVGGIALVLADKPKERDLNDFGHLMSLAILFLLLDALVIAVVVIPLSRRIQRSATFRRMDFVRQACLLILLFLGVAIAVCVVFFAACQGIIGAVGG